MDPGRYFIPLWVTLPQRNEATNLLVVAAPSASHIGMSTLRMEPQFMIVGHSAGVVAAMSAASGADAQEVPMGEVQRKLLEDGQILDPHSLGDME